MSIDRCQRCGDLVDTDEEPEAYVQVSNMRNSEEYICLCRRHREEREAERQEPTDLDARIAEEIASDPRNSCPDCDWDVDGCSPCEKHEDL